MRVLEEQPILLPPSVLVVAKAPVVGRVKTRLGVRIGMAAAAELAAAALLDTIDACAAYAPGRCHLALEGDLAQARRGAEVRRRLSGWRVFAQEGQGLGERLAHAHGHLAGPRVQVGMDTPQVTPAQLGEVVAGLEAHRAVVAPATDGGWWALALRVPGDARVLRRVTMSTADTARRTRAALATLRDPGGPAYSVGTAAELTDVDTVSDADQVGVASSGEFGAAWRRLVIGASP